MTEMPANNLLEYLLKTLSVLPEIQEEAEAIQEILAILDNPDNGGGATYSLFFGSQLGQPFYAVALDNRLTERMNSPENLGEAIQGFLARNRRLLSHPRCCVGIWIGINPDGVRQLFLDVAVLVYQEAVARDFGVESDQIAIFNLQAGMEIDIGGTGFPVILLAPAWERLQELERQDRVGHEKGD